MNNDIFNTARDKEQIANGTHFFCQTHQTAMPIEEISYDTRYCKSCYEFLLDESNQLQQDSHKKHKPNWIPLIPPTYKTTWG